MTLSNPPHDPWPGLPRQHRHPHRHRRPGLRDAAPVRAVERGHLRADPGLLPIFWAIVCYFSEYWRQKTWGVIKCILTCNKAALEPPKPIPVISLTGDDEDESGAGPSGQSKATGGLSAPLQLPSQLFTRYDANESRTALPSPINNPLLSALNSVPSPTASSFAARLQARRQKAAEDPETLETHSFNSDGEEGIELEEPRKVRVKVSTPPQEASLEASPILTPQGGLVEAERRQSVEQPAPEETAAPEMPVDDVEGGEAASGGEEVAVDEDVGQEPSSSSRPEVAKQAERIVEEVVETASGQAVDVEGAPTRTADSIEHQAGVVVETASGQAVDVEGAPTRTADSIEHQAAVLVETASGQAVDVERTAIRTADSIEHQAAVVVETASGQAVDVEGAPARTTDPIEHQAASAALVEPASVPEASEHAVVYPQEVSMTVEEQTQVDGTADGTALAPVESHEQAVVHTTVPVEAQPSTLPVPAPSLPPAWESST